MVVLMTETRCRREVISRRGLIYLEYKPKSQTVFFNMTRKILIVKVELLCCLVIVHRIDNQDGWLVDGMVAIMSRRLADLCSSTVAE